MRLFTNIARQVETLLLTSCAVIVRVLSHTFDMMEIFWKNSFHIENNLLRVVTEKFNHFVRSS